MRGRGGLSRADHRGVRCKLQIFPRGKAQKPGQRGKMLLFQGIVEPCDRIVVDQAAGIDHAVVAVGRFDAALVGLVCLDGRAALGHGGHIAHGLRKPLLLFQHLCRSGKRVDGGRRQHQLGRRTIAPEQFQKRFQCAEAGGKLQADLFHGNFDVVVQFTETAIYCADPDCKQKQ